MVVQYKHDHNLKQRQDGGKMFMTLAFPEKAEFRVKTHSNE